MGVKNKRGEIITPQQFFDEWDDCEDHMPEAAAMMAACENLGITHEQACDLMAEEGEARADT